MVVLNKLIYLLKDFFNLKHFLIHLLLLLVLVDLIFITFHFFYIISLNDFGIFFKKFNNELFSIEKDQGYAEIYQYAKEFCTMLLLFILYLRKKENILLIWSLFFLYFLSDDLLSIHENFGKYVADNFNYLNGYILQYVSEILLVFITAIILLSFLIITYFKTTDEIKKFTKHLFILLILLSFFGVFLDALESFLNHDWRLGVIEDGGEMIIMSIILTYVFTHNQSSKKNQYKLN
jgi:hypothetical protein